MMGTQDFCDDFNGLRITENQDINILLLGETGVGKSTFINSIANYLHFKDFKKACKEELLVLIPTPVTVTNEDFEEVTIRIGSDRNEYQEVGAAATQDVKTYVFPIGNGKTKLRLIDSPGMGDPRGITQDDMNCEYILSYLAQLKELHAICFLMKPTNTRLTIFFEYCVNQILSRLEKSASNNIIFIFTNTRGTNYTPGDTLPCLRKVVEEIKAKPPHVEIPLDNNIFSVDNEAFKFLVAVKYDVKVDKYVEERCIESWNNSSKECWRFISYIVGDASRSPLKPHQIQNTVSINEARRLVMQLSQPLADISQLIYDNIRILEKHQYNLKITNQSLDELKKKLYIPIINLQVTQLTQPVTVCTSTKCADVVKVGDVKKWHYRQRCHDPCYLTSVSKQFVGDPNLQNCAAMSGRTCIKCTCDFSVHMHIYYMTKTVDDKIVDDVVKNSIQQKETAVAEAKRLIGEIDKRKKELEDERDIIVKSTAQFAHFLQHNAICPFSDSYKAYIEYLINREKGLGRADQDKMAIQNLEELLRRYEEIKTAFDNTLQLSSQYGLNVIESSVTPKSVLDTIHKLYNLKHNGKKINELLKKQKASRGSEYDKNCEYVHPKTAGIFKDKLKKDKKQGAKSTDDENKTKKDSFPKHKKDGKNTDDEKKNKSQKGSYAKNKFSQQDNRPRNPMQHSQHYRQSNPQNFSHRDPPPPYPGQDKSTHHQQRPYSKSSGKEDVESDIVVQVKLSQPSKKQEEKPASSYPYQGSSSNYYDGRYNPEYYRYGPPSGPYGVPPGPSQASAPSYGPPPPPPPPPPHTPYSPHDPYYPLHSGSPYAPRDPYYSQHPHYGPPHGHYGPTQGAPHYPPPQGSHHAPPPPQYQHYRPPPGETQGPPPQGQQQGQGFYQKNYNAGRGRQYNKRGGNNKRGRSKPRSGKDKKSGTERSASSGSESSS